MRLACLHLWRRRFSHQSVFGLLQRPPCHRLAYAPGRELLQAGDKAVTERRAKEFEARAVRTRANERGLLAMEAERKLNKAQQHGDSFAC